MRWATRQDRPTLIACKTQINKGAGPMEGDAHGHGYALFDKEIAAAREAMGWTSPPFEIPDDVAEGLAQGRPARPRRAGARWEGRLKRRRARAPPSSAPSRGDLPADAFAALDEHIAKAAAEQPAAPRASTPARRWRR